jgi:hypothetical protein
MKIKALAVLALSAALFGANQAGATQLVAGWDMGQWCNPGFTCDSGFALYNTMDAAYSDLDPNGLGAESAALGIMLFDGTAGSTAITPSFGDPGPWIPAPGVAATDQNTFVHTDFPGLEMGNPGNCASFAIEGIDLCADFAMNAQNTIDIVFKADLSSLGQTGANWEFSFAAAAQSTDVVVSVSFSDDGVNYTPVVVNENVTSAGEVVAGSVAGSPGSMAFVKLSLAAGTLIDNLAIKADVVPEPGTVLLGLAGLAGLVAFGRRRA